MTRKFPQHFTFHHIALGTSVLYSASRVGDTVQVTWPGRHVEDELAVYDAGEVASAIERGEWFNVREGMQAASAPVQVAVETPPVVQTAIEQLVAVATERCYCVTFYPGEHVLVEDLEDGGSTGLNSVEDALKWFDLKAQLDALEAEGS